MGLTICSAASSRRISGRNYWPPYPAELKVKIEHDADLPSEPTPIAAAHSAEEKLRAYWAMKGTPPADRQERLLAKLADIEATLLSTA